MADPYADFQQAASVDPYADFAAPAKQAVPADDYTPLREAYDAKRHAVAAGASPDVIAGIDARIHDFTQKMRQEDVRRSVEGMGATGRFLAGAGAGLTNVWQHAKEAGTEIVPNLMTGEPAFDPSQMEDLKRETPQVVAGQVAQRQQTQQEAAPLTGTLAGELGNIAGEAAGTTPIALATGGAGPVIGSALAGAGTGALMAEPGQRLEGAGIGGLAGGTIGVVGKVASVPIKGIVKPSREAQQLADLGIEGITAGQAAPGSAVAHFEQAAESTPLGASVKAAREELPLNLEHRIIQEAAPPGYKPTLGRNELVADRLGELGQEYNRRYDALLDTQPIPKGAVIRDVLLQNAQGAKSSGLTAIDEKATESFLKNQLSGFDAKPTLQGLHRLRSEVGAGAKDIAETQPLVARHLRDIKDTLTDHLNRSLKASLDPEAAAKLKALDSAYSRYKTVLKAVPVDPGGPVSITPHRLSMAIRGSMTPDQYARGGGGDMRVLARAGKMVTSPPRPTTGALTGVLHSLPFAGPWATGVAGYASSHYPEAMLGQMLPQRVLQKTLMQPVVSGALGQAARAGAEDLLIPGPEAPPDYEAAPLPAPAVLTQTLKRKKK